MATPLHTYELSQQADQDLEEVFDYTIEKFGLTQAIKYLGEFEIVFENLCTHPELGRKRHEIRKGLLSISHESHTIFYRIMKDRIRIVRVLHSSRDIVKFLKPRD